MAGEVSNFSFLISTMQMLAWMQEDSRRQAEIEGLPRQLEGDVEALAHRFPGPNDQSLRRMLADPLMSGLSASTRDGRRKMIEYCGLALTLDPEHSIANNNLAWALASAPGDPWFDPKRALELARKAVALNPPDGSLWNTMGVVAYRAGDWKTAAETLKKSNRINGGTGIDCFFLAMTYWQQGDQEEAPPVV